MTEKSAEQTSACSRLVMPAGQKSLLGAPPPPAGQKSLLGAPPPPAGQKSLLGAPPPWLPRRYPDKPHLYVNVHQPPPIWGKPERPELPGSVVNFHFTDKPVRPERNSRREPDTCNHGMRKGLISQEGKGRPITREQEVKVSQEQKRESPQEPGRSGFGQEPSKFKELGKEVASPHMAAQRQVPLGQATVKEIAKSESVSAHPVKLSMVDHIFNRIPAFAVGMLDNVDAVIKKKTEVLRWPGDMPHDPLPVNRFVDVEIIEISHDPDGFFDFAGAIKEYMEERGVDGEYHEKVALAATRVPATYPSHGQLVLAPFEGQYYRAAALNGEKVWFLDYGNVSALPDGKAKFFPRELLAKPPFCYLFKLDGNKAKLDEVEPGTILKVKVKRVEDEALVYVVDLGEDTM